VGALGRGEWRGGRLRGTSGGRARCGGGSGRGTGRRRRPARRALQQQLWPRQDENECQREAADHAAGEEETNPADLLQIHLCIMRHFP
jgi:hypothetical protein